MPDMATPPRKGITLDYLVDKRAQLLAELRSDGHHADTQTRAYGFHDPLDVPPAYCDTCHAPPVLERIEGVHVRWVVICSECGRTLPEARKRPWLALLAWNAINLASQDYRDLPLFGLSELDPAEAHERMVGIRRDLEIRTRLAGIERTIAKRTHGRIPGHQYRLRLEAYLQWALLALRLTKMKERKPGRPTQPGNQQDR